MNTMLANAGADLVTSEVLSLVGPVAAVVGAGVLVVAVLWGGSLAKRTAESVVDEKFSNDEMRRAVKETRYDSKGQRMSSRQIYREMHRWNRRR